MALALGCSSSSLPDPVTHRETPVLCHNFMSTKLEDDLMIHRWWWCL